MCHQHGCPLDLTHVHSRRIYAAPTLHLESPTNSPYRFQLPPLRRLQLVTSAFILGTIGALAPLFAFAAGLAWVCHFGLQQVGVWEGRVAMRTPTCPLKQGHALLLPRDCGPPLSKSYPMSSPFVSFQALSLRGYEASTRTYWAPPLHSAVSAVRAYAEPFLLSLPERVAAAAGPAEEGGAGAKEAVHEEKKKVKEEGEEEQEEEAEEREEEGKTQGVRSNKVWAHTPCSTCPCHDTVPWAC